MSIFTIEVVASSVMSCVNAQQGGAGRIELCSALATAGVTPSSGMLELVKQNISIPVYVMIRPREGDFVYDNKEVEVFKREIELLQKSGADGFVFGLLKPDGQIDIALTTALVKFCHPYPVTFHRAIDCTPDPVRAVGDVIETGCTRILTSGGAATGPEGIDTILAMNEYAQGKISIMPGGGIRPETFGQMLNKGIREYHLSGRVAMPSQTQTNLFDMSRAETSEASIAQVVKSAGEFFSSEKN